MYTCDRSVKSHMSSVVALKDAVIAEMNRGVSHALRGRLARAKEARIASMSVLSLSVFAQLAKVSKRMHGDGDDG
jgi:hypothetical protein